MNIDKDTIERMKEEHGEVYMAESDEYAVLFKPAKGAEWEMFLDSSADPKKRARATRRLFRACVVFPDKPQIDAMLEEKPALAEVFGNEIATVAGISQDVTVKKL